MDRLDDNPTKAACKKKKKRGKTRERYHKTQKMLRKWKQSIVKHCRKLKEGLRSTLYLAYRWSLERAIQLEVVRAKART